MPQSERSTARRSAAQVATPAAGEHSALTGDLSVVVAGLHESFDRHLGPDAVEAEIQRVADQFTHARIRSYVPLLVRRYAAAGLRRRSLNPSQPAAGG